MLKILNGLFNGNDRQIEKLKPIVDQINSFEEAFKSLTDKEIKQKTQNWKDELQKFQNENSEKEASGQKTKEYLDQILPEAFALAKEATRRVQNIRLHDVQLMAGIALHQGKVAEQKTGEGKTNTAVLPLYLNSLTGKGAHLVTPNDYLARHGAGWMGVIYEKLGITTGVIMQEKAFVYDPEFENQQFEDAYARNLKEVPRQQAYQCEVTYGTNHEFGFDYLRDNMVRSLADMTQTNKNGDWGVHNFAIVDEVDSILIDVARTPLIISTSDSKATERYHDASRIVRGLLKDTDYEVDEKYKTATLTDLGIRKVENLVGVSNLYEQDFEMVHLLEQALAAHTVYEKDRDYVVKEGQVLIVDQFTGRILLNNRYSHGLHQAIEAKENVEIQQESKTLAEISYQNYFRMYEKLAGMTGTAVTEAEEFYEIYKLDVVVIPTNKPIARQDFNDVVYKTEAGKFKAVADEVERCHKNGQPVLVGTTSVEKSQLLHTFLQRKKIPHEILNAKNHEKEALIIAQAGSAGAVTVSTNMAGRGVDIILGGDPPQENSQQEVLDAGGLHVIGTERHESRRIDNQLRGRAGRQGDAGSSRFFVSLQDDLMRVFGGAQVEALMNRFGIDDGTPLEAGIVSKAIENAQKKVEGFNFDRRKSVVEMDDVMNVHRDVVYRLRRRVLEISEAKEDTKEWFFDKISEYDGFNEESWKENEERFGAQVWPSIFGQLSLPVIDTLWMEHLVDMDQLKEGIGLRGYAQRDPMVEYKKEGHERFEILVDQMYATIADRLVKFTQQNIDFDQGALSARASIANAAARNNITYTHGELESGVSNEASEVATVNSAGARGGAGEGTNQTPQIKDSSGRTFKVQEVKSGQEKVGRNDPCPCGSGKKYKHCCGKNA